MIQAPGVVIIDDDTTDKKARVFVTNKICRLVYYLRVRHDLTGSGRKGRTHWPVCPSISDKEKRFLNN